MLTLSPPLPLGPPVEIRNLLKTPSSKPQIHRVHPPIEQPTHPRWLIFVFDRRYFITSALTAVKRPHMPSSH